MNEQASIVRSEWLLMAMVGVLLCAQVSQAQTTSIISSGLNAQVSHTAGYPNYDITAARGRATARISSTALGTSASGLRTPRFLNEANPHTTNILSRVTAITDSRLG